MQKIDFKKELAELYKVRANSQRIIDVPTLHYLSIEGMGTPGSEVHSHAIQALFKLSYTLKFMIKKSDTAIDYGVLPLEGLWWADDSMDFVRGQKQNWQWRMMIMQPEFINQDQVDEAISSIVKKAELPALRNISFKAFSEGKAAQIVHRGPFSEEGPTVEKLHEFIAQSGHQLRGKHHEIYLSDIRRAAPANWKTIIRQPII